MMSLGLMGGGGYTVELYKFLYVDFIITYNEKHSILVCWDMAKLHTYQLEMNAPVGGVYNQTYSVKGQLASGFSDIGLVVSGILSFLSKSK